MNSEQMSNMYLRLMSLPLEALFSPTVGKMFEGFTTDQQRDLVEKLLAFIRDIRDGTNEKRKSLGVPLSDNESENETTVRLVLDKCYWQLSQFLRYSNPTRITEAAPYVRLVIEQFDSIHQGSKGDVTPLFYLGAALQKSGEDDEEALRVFREGFRHHALPGSETGPNNVLWAQGNMSRLLRKMGRIAEAEGIEATIRDWLKWHPYGMPPSQFKSLVLDPDHVGKDYTYTGPPRCGRCF